jgi:hydroxysqualene dehydroxylase
MPIVHIIGAGVSGLAAATSLAERNIPVNLYEAQTIAGGRARASSTAHQNRSFDHGVYSMMGSYTQSWKLVERIHAGAHWQALPRCYDYMDSYSGERWTLRAPFFIPPAPIADYGAPLRLLTAHKDAPIRSVVDPFHPLYESWVTPLTRMALGMQPDEASAKALGIVLRRTFLKGRKAMTRHVPRHSIHSALIAPALQFLESHGNSTYYGHQLTHLEGNGRISTLAFTRKQWPIGKQDAVILATPPHVTQMIDPSIPVPQATQSMITVHFLLPHRERDYHMLGLIGGPIDYLLFKPEQIVAVCHAAEHLFHLDNTMLTERLWKQVRVALPYLPTAMPPFQMFKDCRAGFLSTPHIKRPAIHTRIPNLFLAGDYTATHLPASIESAALSGHLAAEAAIKSFRHH